MQIHLIDSQRKFLEDNIHVQHWAKPSLFYQNSFVGYYLWSDSMPALLEAKWILNIVIAESITEISIKYCIHQHLRLVYKKDSLF